jgi:hypothetical protein
MEDRRKSERMQTRLKVQCETNLGVMHGTLINCSAAGCFVEGQVEEPGDEPVKLTIQLPNGSSIQLWGTVAYYLPTMGFGLHFTHHTGEDQLMFDQWRNYLEGETRTLNPPTSKPTSITAA